MSEVERKPTSVIKARLGIQKNGPAHAFFTSECAKAMDKFTPFDTGTLAETVILNGQPTANVTINTITYDVPYAKYVYYPIRNGKRITYNTDIHSLAGPYWDKRMWSAKGKEIVKNVQNYVNKYGDK